MSLEPLTIKEKLIISIDSNSADNVVPLFSYIPYTKSGYRLIDEYLEIENLKVISWIYSIDPIEFPVFELKDTESKQLLTALNLEWKSERIQLDIVLRINETSIWHKIGSYSLLNADPYPYREYSLGNHSLGNNSVIGLQVKDVGYGLLKTTINATDKIVAFGDFKRNILLEKLVDDGIKIANNITTTVSTIINRNLDRKGLTLFNSSDKNIYIDSASTLSLNTYQLKLEPGDYWEAPSPIYTGVYYGIVSNGSTAIDIREFI
ncbi:hypothetical protein [uncultured Nostoc sp.]|uniref:hypothetical protein n=1 Tax=uncultured Nostoc sp. TaxID=340711 RepID=UPI0035C9E7C7